MQNVRLYSADGSAYLLAKTNGDLALYTSGGGHVWDAGSGGGSAPYSLVMQEVSLPCWATQHACPEGQGLT